jgi:glutamate-1-semialdehyde 2,1-aminomutase
MRSESAADALMATYSAELCDSSYADGSKGRLAGGATHDSWRYAPFPVVFERGAGAHKWDVSGRRYVDLWMGHGSLMLGNAHPAVVEVVSRQAALGQHLGGVHRLHHEWAELICQTVTSCELIRFTASGTEATLLAMRVARAWTGRSRIVRIDGHFHGWHDDALAHTMPAATAGFNPGSADYVSLAAPLDLGAVADELSDNEVAAVILEPGGGSAGCLPWSSAYLQAVRKLTQAHGTLLIFDEVISGFRYAPGGVQQLAGVKPDLTVLAKIAAGGMPGGIVGGSSAVMGVIGGGPASHGGAAYVPHSGTFNGFPLSAAAARATIELIADGAVGRYADRAAVHIVEGINRAARSYGIDVRAFNQSSIFHIMIGSVGEGVTAAPGPAAILLARQNAPLHRLLRAALLLERVDCHASHGWVSAVHDSSAVEEVISGFSRAFVRLSQIPEFIARESDPTTITRDTCDSVCHRPDCAARLRAVAGCSLPLAGTTRKGSA